LRRKIIELGIADLLINIFNSRDLDQITHQYIQAFFVLTYPSNKNTCKLLFDKKALPSLLRLFDSKDKDLVFSNAQISFTNILYYVALELDENIQHPFINEL
jgi:hypothetical protein